MITTNHNQTESIIPNNALSDTKYQVISSHFLTG